MSLEKKRRWVQQQVDKEKSDINRACTFTPQLSRSRSKSPNYYWTEMTLSADKNELAYVRQAAWLEKRNKSKYLRPVITL